MDVSLCTSGAKRVQIRRACRFGSDIGSDISSDVITIWSAIKRDHPIGEHVDFRLRMGNDEYGDALYVEGLDKIAHTGCSRLVKSCGRLVHNKDLRLACDDARYGGKSLLSAGKVEWRTIGKMLDMQQRHGLIDAFGYLRFVKMLVAWSVGDILGYGFGEKLTFRMLHDVADGGVQFLTVRTFERLHIAVGALACDGNGIDGDVAGLRLVKRAEKTREGGFACTVMPCDCHGFALIDGYGKLIEHRLVTVWILVCQITDFNDWYS